MDLLDFLDFKEIEKENNNNSNILSHKRNSKDVGCKNKGGTHSSGGIGNNTTKVKRKAEDHKCGHIH